ncbi:MAG: ABC transporter permease [Bacillota bacterium]
MVFAWYTLSQSLDNHYLLPSPKTVGIEILSLISKIENLIVIGKTLLRLIITLVIASLFGIITGFLAAKVIMIDYLIRPVITILRTTPIAAIIVIILVLVGRLSSVYIIVLLILFPIIYEGSKRGVLNIDDNIIDAYRLEPSSSIQSFFYVYFPLALSNIKTALLQSVGLGFKVLVMAEFIVQTNQSIGAKLYEASVSIYYSTIFSWAIITILIAISIETLVHKIKTV